MTEPFENSYINPIHQQVSPASHPDIGTVLSLSDVNVVPHDETRDTGYFASIF